MSKLIKKTNKKTDKLSNNKLNKDLLTETIIKYHNTKIHLDIEVL